MSDIDDVDLPFLESEWIGQKKKYDNSLPAKVTAAHEDNFKIPVHFHEKLGFPPPELSVYQLLHYTLPRLSSEIILTKPDIWFSADKPHTFINLNDIVDRPIPSTEFLTRLAEQKGQAWIDGKKSISDPRFNDGRDRLPLWVVTYWIEVARILGVRAKWEESWGWIKREEIKHLQKKEPSNLTVFQEAQQQLEKLPWDSVMKYCQGTARTSHLSRVLGTYWLSDDHINMMVEKLVVELNQNCTGSAVEAPAKVAIAGLSFALDIQNVHAKLSLPNGRQRSRTQLSFYEAKAKSEGLERLYFPVHVHRNHWVAGMIDFRRKVISFGDSLQDIRSGPGAPAKFISLLQVWLKQAFGGKKFKSEGNGLRHAVQDDQYSCGIITINTIAHAVLGSALWDPQNAVKIRIQWFTCLSKNWEIPRQELSVAPVSNSRLSLLDLLNPDPDNCNIKEVAIHNLATTSVYHSGYDSDSDNGVVSGSHEKPTKISIPSKRRMHTEETISSSLDLDSNSVYSTSDEEPNKRIKAGEGTSRSAIASRQLRQQAKEKSFTPNKIKLSAWKKKILADDKLAQFDPKDVRRVRHSNCGIWVLVKEPYDYTRWKSHTGECQKKIGSEKKAPPTLEQMGWFKARMPKPESKLKENKSRELVSVSRAVIPARQVPCPGVTEADNPLVSQYLRRTSTFGGGGRSLPDIAKEKFNVLFSELGSRKKRQEVIDTQMQEWKWKNDHAYLRVFSTACHLQVDDRSAALKHPKPCTACSTLLHSQPFRNAIRKPIPPDSNYAFINKRFRNPLLGEIYTRTLGVRELIESDAKSSPFVRYALGALKGQYNNEVFNGLLHAIVSRHEKEERGVGNQNFLYMPAWEEMCHILRIHSPCAYNSLKEYLPMPDKRTLQKKEARQPRFPMSICGQSFESVYKHLKSLDYNGPIALSCDDTKLFATFRLFWDKEEQAHFLVGSTEGPIRVENPENVREVIAQAQASKATKIRLYLATLPYPGLAPVLVAAVPITSLDATELLSMFKSILDGLIDKGILVVSYACDGTEVERAVQRLFLTQLEDQRIEYTIPSPSRGRAVTTVVYGVYRGQHICMVQDSKHALKTMRNNLFSGARLLVFRNFVALFVHIVTIATGNGAPLFNRDVHRTDRQDDNAATRIFSADTLKYISDHHPEMVGTAIYLFIFGDLIDAYQNRNMPHLERIKLALRTRYFLDSWELYLSVCGYRKDRHFISREANDILRIIIEGLISLIIIHRNNFSGRIPLLPWLHSSEACEHIFGEARQVVKDFTFLDFIYMIPKLRIKLHEAVLRGKSANGKARASGYSHTYFDNEGLDLHVLSTFPSDSEIASVAKIAAQEVDSIIGLLGVNADMLHQLQPHNSRLELPSIRSWFDDELEKIGEAEELEAQLDNDVSEAEVLQALIDDLEEEKSGQSKVLEKICGNLTSAAMAVAAEEICTVNKFSLIDTDEHERVASEEYAQLHSTMHMLTSAPSLTLSEVNLTTSKSRLLGRGNVCYDDLDFHILCEMRRQHQTKQAALGVRTSSTTRTTPSVTTRGLIIRRFHEVLKSSQDDCGMGTGLERQHRWRQAAPGGQGGVVEGVLFPEPTAGNSANAAAASAAVAKKAANRRFTVFLECSVPNVTEVSNAGVTQARPLQILDYGFVVTPAGIMIGQVIALYSKTAGKNGKHSAVTESSNIAAISYIAVQLFQHSVIRQFRSVTDATAIFQTKQFLLMPSIQFLSVIKSSSGIAHTEQTTTSIELSSADFGRFRAFREGTDAIVKALERYNKRATVTSLDTADY